ncbi:MAG: hypothetical protein IPM54_02170 [Polyangiaceae bacterium]|nr:hypothetical protein [Polyangiaceae bacterium]
MGHIEALFQEACALRAAEVSLELHRDSVEVIWPKLGRGHEVRFLQDNVSDTLMLVALVARAAQIEKISQSDLCRIMLLQNRATRVVAFRRTVLHGHIEATVVCRASTLSSEELQYYLLIVAREADRLELVLTGTDARLRGRSR